MDKPFSPQFHCYALGPLINEFDAPPGTLTFIQDQDVCKLDTDADFECKRLVMFSDRTQGPQTEATRDLPNFNFNIRDNATGRTIFAGFASVPEIFGDGRVPFVLPTSHFFRRGGQAQMLYNPADPGPDFEAVTVWLVMVGVKHYERG